MIATAVKADPREDVIVRVNPPKGSEEHHGVS
jgi:hypothetical protein